MSVEENKTLVRREQEELWNHTGDLDAAEELFAAGQAQAAKQQAAHFRRGFPDVVSTIEDLKLPCLIGWCHDEVYATVGHRLTHLVLHAGSLGEQLRENYAGGACSCRCSTPHSNS